MVSVTVLILYLITTISALNFDWERNQLTDIEAFSNSAIRFGSLESPVVEEQEECRIVPGDVDWPSETTWALLNDTLGGALLKPRPLASVCYYGADYNAAKCEQLRNNWKGMNLHSCTPTSYPNSTCTQGGFPIYVVRATTVKHIQIAVNFARNNNIRLVIKNTGHDFNGKSIGGYALSVWTHNLKDMTYHAKYTSPTGSYTGRAVAYSAGVQAYEGTVLMNKEKMTFIVAGGSTVGIAGGFLQGGGHSGCCTSYYGLAADQVLALTAVTADGRVVESHEGLNEDLFWAFRGGGGGTFGIITSVIVRAFPQTSLVSSSIRFSTTPSPGSSTSISTETFWAGMKAYWEFSPQICDAGGLGYSFIYPANTPTGLTFTVNIAVPNTSVTALRSFLRPLLQELNDLGIALPIPTFKRSLH
ncbi:FAD-binding domain-containing protein, partial [Plenodomus tracheiphilus IPT5]